MGVSQAVVCITLGDISPICFRSLSVLVKMVSVDFNCYTSTGSVGVSIPAISHVSRGTCLFLDSYKELEVPGSIPWTGGLPLRAPSGPLAILCCLSDISLLLLDMLYALDTVVIWSFCFHSSVTGQAPKTIRVWSPPPAKDAKTLHKCASWGQGLS